MTKDDQVKLLDRSHSNTPNLDWLRQRVRTLHSLLDEPHTGLASWQHMYGDLMEEITEFWDSKR